MPNLLYSFVLPKRKGNNNSRKNNTDSFRFCRICKISKELTSDNFHKSKNRYLGFEYVCKPCEKIRIKTKPKRKKRILNSEQKIKRKATQLKYYKTLEISFHRVMSYKSIDKKKGLSFDLTIEWYKENIEGKSCYYCGDSESSIGCDRIDNLQGHTKLNVVPCCKLCNVTRMNNFTHDEMIILGRTIKQLKKSRVLAADVMLEAGKTYA